MNTVLARSSAVKPLSQRKRKLRETSLVLMVAGIVAGLVGAVWIRRHQPKRYAPGEVSSDVTNELAKKLPPNAPKPVFLDVTKETGLSAFRNFAGPRTSQLPEDNGPGLAWGDFDNDGDDDLFL